MNIKATCANCEREFFLDQLLEGSVRSGTCPWCDVLLAPGYAGHLIETIEGLHSAGRRFEDALVASRGGWTGFRIKRDSVLDRIEELLEQHERHISSAGRRRPQVRPMRHKKFSHLTPQMPP